MFITLSVIFCVVENGPMKFIFSISLDKFRVCSFNVWEALTSIMHSHRFAARSLVRTHEHGTTMILIKVMIISLLNFKFSYVL